MAHGRPATAILALALGSTMGFRCHLQMSLKVLDLTKMVGHTGN